LSIGGTSPVALLYHRKHRLHKRASGMSQNRLCATTCDDAIGVFGALDVTVNAIFCDGNALDAGTSNAEKNIRRATSLDAGTVREITRAAHAKWVDRAFTWRQRIEIVHECEVCGEHIVLCASRI
jgi:hypothetical protein